MIDSLKFATALSPDKLLDAHDTEILTAGKATTRRGGNKDAFAFEDATTRDEVRYFGHGGGASGITPGVRGLTGSEPPHYGPGIPGTGPRVPRL